MRYRTALLLCAIVALITAPVLALNPDDELWIPAAARGAGNEGSFWMTDLYLMNLGEETATVAIAWLERAEDNSEAAGFEYEVAAGETLVLEDVIAEVFGAQEANGAIWIELVEEDEGDGARAVNAKADDDGSIELIATARIYNLDDGETFGQGFEGLRSDAAIAADGEDTTHVVGITDNSSFRTNWYGLNLSEEDDTWVDGEVMVEVLDLDGSVLAAETYSLAPLAPVLLPVSGLGAGTLDNATLRFTMIEGAGLFGAAKIDQASNDPTTLEAHWACSGDNDDEEFTSDFFIEGCTFATTGANPFFPLVPGLELELEGEEDGVPIAATVTVLDETFEVDGVETRVVEERESEDGELVEVSRNYFAHCVETGSVFYFGEHVDDYEDGEIVGHEGEWLAGVDGAQPGIIMPGTILLGSRYFQEIAPGVAMDRAEIEAMGLEVETEAGSFDRCIRTIDSSPLSPGEEDEKLFCPGIGNVVDEELELVSFTDPSAP